jgi:serine/threonine protein phosphatase PrpC
LLATARRRRRCRCAPTTAASSQAQQRTRAATTARTKTGACITASRLHSLQPLLTSPLFSRSFVCGEASAALGRYFAVFDGHGGAGAAQHCYAMLRAAIEAALDREEAAAAPPPQDKADVADDDVADAEEDVPSPRLQLPAWDSPPPAAGSARAAALERAVVAGFLSADASYADVARRSGADDGSAAVVACVLGCRPGALRCLLAWAGDCSALLLRRDGTAVALTAPHSALNPSAAEAQRFAAAGGEFRRGRALLRRADHRHVSLAMTRAIGDFEDAAPPLSPPLSPTQASDDQSTMMIPEPPPHVMHPVPSAAVTAAPELAWLELRPDEHLGLILCSDGVTDVLTPDEACAAATSAAPMAAHAAAAVVAAAARAAPPGTPRADDATAVVVLLAERDEEQAARLRLSLNRMAHAAQPADESRKRGRG